MFTTFEEALSWIHGQLKFGMKPGIERMKWMMEQLGNPHHSIKTIHVGGTNGKGSTVTYLRSMLVENGYEVGTFTSPYIETFNERISLNGVPITDEEMVILANAVFPTVEAIAKTELGNATEFEIITVMCFYYFGVMHPVDFAIIEVGLGGRYDSTNIIDPLASVITNIGLDHINILGDSYDQIAFEKAGIIKENKPLFTCAKQQEVLDVFTKECNQLCSSMYTLNKDFFITTQNNEFHVVTPFGSLDNIELSMVGAHQKENAAGAVAALLYLMNKNVVTLEKDKMLIGLKRAFWPGRFEKICEQPTIILDGAHNLEGIHSLVSTLEENYSNRKISIFFTALRDKDCAQMIKCLDSIADDITFVEFSFDRASKAEDLVNWSNHPHKKIAKDALTAVKEKMKDTTTDVIVITGSLYFISEIREKLKKALK